MAKRSVKRGKGRKPAPRRAARVSAVPAGYHTVTPYLTVSDGLAALDFYKRAFGARERMRMVGPDGRALVHAELQIGDSMVMLSDELPGMSSTRAPRSLGGTTGMLFLYVPAVDRAFRRAVDAGCTALTEPADMFWGDRFGKVEDPYGNQWGLATHTEDVSPAQLRRRAREAMAGQGA